MLRLASRTAVPWFLVVALVAVIGGAYVREDDEDACREVLDDWDAFSYKLEMLRQFHAIIEDRTERFMAAHPERTCLRIEDIATKRELWNHNYADVDFVCGNRNYGYRKVLPILTKWKTLVTWPRID